MADQEKKEDPLLKVDQEQLLAVKSALLAEEREIRANLAALYNQVRAQLSQQEEVITMQQELIRQLEEKIAGNAAAAESDDKAIDLTALNGKKKEGATSA